MRSNLKVRFNAERKDKFFDFNPAALQVRFNDEEILIDKLTIEMGTDDIPRATMHVTLTELDLDLDTLIHLAAVANVPVDEMARGYLVLAAKDRLVEELLREGREQVFSTPTRPPFFHGESLEEIRAKLWAIEDDPDPKLWSPRCGICDRVDWQQGCDRLDCNFRDNYTYPEPEPLSLCQGFTWAAISSLAGIALTFMLVALA